LPTGNSGSFRRENAKVFATSNSHAGTNAQFACKSPQGSAPATCIGYKIEKEKKNKKKKQTNKNYTFTSLPTGNSGSFRRENAKIFIVSATHKCAVCSANHPSLCSSCMYMKDTNEKKN
jgi:hypothetical protein